AGGRGSVRETLAGRNTHHAARNTDALKPPRFVDGSGRVGHGRGRHRDRSIRTMARKQGRTIDSPIQSKYDGGSARDSGRTASGSSAGARPGSGNSAGFAAGDSSAQPSRRTGQAGAHDRPEGD